MPDLDLILNQQTFVLYFPFVCNIRPSVCPMFLLLYLRLLAMRLFMKAKKLTGLALMPML
jgi:hypothetical protein